jgi:hypothetical protein
MRKMQILEKRFSIISPKITFYDMGARIEMPKKVWIESELFVSDEDCQKALELCQAQYNTNQYENGCAEPKLYIDWEVIEEKNL